MLGRLNIKRMIKMKGNEKIPAEKKGFEELEERFWKEGDSEVWSKKGVRGSKCWRRSL